MRGTQNRTSRQHAAVQATLPRWNYPGLLNATALPGIRTGRSARTKLSATALSKGVRCLRLSNNSKALVTGRGEVTKRVRRAGTAA